MKLMKNETCQNVLYTKYVGLHNVSHGKCFILVRGKHFTDQPGFVTHTYTHSCLASRRFSTRGQCCHLCSLCIIEGTEAGKTHGILHNNRAFYQGHVCHFSLCHFI